MSLMCRGRHILASLMTFKHNIVLEDIEEMCNLAVTTHKGESNSSLYWE